MKVFVKVSTSQIIKKLGGVSKSKVLMLQNKFAVLQEEMKERKDLAACLSLPIRTWVDAESYIPDTSPATDNNFELDSEDECSEFEAPSPQHSSLSNRGARGHRLSLAQLSNCDTMSSNCSQRSSLPDSRRGARCEYGRQLLMSEHREKPTHNRSLQGNSGSLRMSERRLEPSCQNRSLSSHRGRPPSMSERRLEPSSCHNRSLSSHRGRPPSMSERRFEPSCHNQSLSSHRGSQELQEESGRYHSISCRPHHNSSRYRSRSRSPNPFVEQNDCIGGTPARKRRSPDQEYSTSVKRSRSSFTTPTQQKKALNSENSMSM